MTKIANSLVGYIALLLDYLSGFNYLLIIYLHLPSIMKQIVSERVTAPANAGQATIMRKENSQNWGNDIT